MTVHTDNPATPALEPIAVVGLAAVMPQAPSASAFWSNITGGRYSITETPVDRWDPATYYDPDHGAPDKAYSKIGGWVREFDWNPRAWKLPIPPKVAEQMDEGQRWAVSASRAALVDAGWPGWDVDSERVAVIFGNALGGEKHYRANLRIEAPEILKYLTSAQAMRGLPADVQAAIAEQTLTNFRANTFEINEDTMPGELANVIAGRVANLFNLRGPNFTTDAACASGLAALSTAIKGLQTREYDAVITGGVDRNMGVAAFVKFCKIGALSATGTRPFDAGADGFVMGEGAALFILKRLSDAEKAGDKVYAVILGVGGSSDGKGKGITAPNPVGQRLAVIRAWEAAGADPATVTSVEAHGTSTRVGDAAELTSLTEVFAKAGAVPGSIALGSVKSNIGHLKAAAGAAGLFKMVMSLHEKKLAPSLNFTVPNENVDWDAVPFKVTTELRDWEMPAGATRRGAVSAFGFGGSNFHVALEEYVPGRYAGRTVFAAAQVPSSVTATASVPTVSAAVTTASAAAAPSAVPVRTAVTSAGQDSFVALGQALADMLAQGLRLADGAHAAQVPATAAQPAPAVAVTASPATSEPVVITGAAVGLPGVPRVFDDENVSKILEGQQFISSIPQDLRRRMVDMRITRLVKSEGRGPVFESIDTAADVIKLYGARAPLDVVAEFGIDPARDAALDTATRLAIGAGFDALRDAGIPLVQHYKTTTLGTRLPERWGLPDDLRDETGIVFASAFPGYDNFAADLEHYARDRAQRENLLGLEGVRAQMTGAEPTAPGLDVLIAALKHELTTNPFEFDRRFIFRVLAMGHSQFAEIIGARGPNTQINVACASTTQAVSLAEDWIKAGRCRRVIVVAADDATAEHLAPWITSGFLATGAAATDENVEDAATPFDRRRHGMIIGMGAAALVVESADAARERGIQPIAEVLASVTFNSAFHGTRLDVEHICGVMEQLMTKAELRGINRAEIANSLMFMSHETYTPARGGSAAAEINALRRTFGAAADQIVITNTKGFTGHAMGAGIEDVVAVKALETGIVPPVPNYKEPDPDLGTLNLSIGGSYPVHYALRLAAGFGSQVAMTLLRWTPMPDGHRQSPHALGFVHRIAGPATFQGWLDKISAGSGATLEVVQRRLRVVDPTAPKRAPTAVPVTLPAAVLSPPASDSAVDGLLVAAPATAPAACDAPAADVVKDAVTAIVAEMTGYPPQLLDPDLDLEADLGVDTVKQAEVFAGVREHFGVERDPNLQLRDFPTLNHVIGWVRSKTGIQAPPAGPRGEADDVTVSDAHHWAGV